MRFIIFVCFLNLAMCLQLAFAGEVDRSYSHIFFADSTVSDKESKPSEIQMEKAVSTSDDESTLLYKFVIEPTIGTWYSSGDESRSYGAFGDLTTWREPTAKGSAWSPGIDLFAVISHGKSKISAYSWDEKTFGGGPALKYVSPKIIEPWQWAIKLRFLFTQTDGENSEQPYKMTQRDFTINPYTEYIKRAEAVEWLWGMTAEARIALSKTRNSTWSADTPNNTNYGNISVFAQYEFTPDIQGRLTLAGLYEGWDKKYGIEVSPELRLNETFMLGVKSAKIGDASVTTGFLRVDFGEPLRKLYR